MTDTETIIQNLKKVAERLNELQIGYVSVLILDADEAIKMREAIMLAVARLDQSTNPSKSRSYLFTR